ncbi:mycofactocin system transcriptional regulator [Aeromicrobium sp. PE09-221]|uniref:mycofactocin system transcriptional regulator n=1 Tax=Aeromicrobium sp. PE09-221 TaxID=1898043 RepID=UPI000B3ED438|nr:mycofactocin system transcriptional regulator [Aeromicrobium sp. PE09-221]OUZ10275.1 mycofactocin system transcriptional regulator [Aeromicrobium sp. PE09-221]
MTPESAPPRTTVGRPGATSHAEIEQAAFDLFTDRGFDQTTMGDIADAVGVGRRTLFRYFPSKNDIPWGQFDRTLEAFRLILDQAPRDIALHEAVHRSVVTFNAFPDDARPPHRDRMRLILSTPSLQAHSVLRYADWRRVIVEFVARRTGQDPTDALPRTVGHVSLALALSAYESWLEQQSSSITTLLDEAMAELRWYLK